MNKLYQFFSQHIKNYKREYVMGLFWWFAIVKMGFLLTGFFWSIYYAQYHASAIGPNTIDATYCKPIHQTEIPETQCIALTEIYNKMWGQDWTNNNNRWEFWNINSWYGVEIIW